MSMLWWVNDDMICQSAAWLLLTYETFELEVDVEVIFKSFRCHGVPHLTRSDRY